MHACTSLAEFVAAAALLTAIHTTPPLPARADPPVALELGDLDPLLGRVIAQSAATAPRGSREVRVDTFDARSNRTGYILIDPQTGHFDRYDSLSRHTGTGTIVPPPRSGDVPPTLRLDERRAK